MWAVRMLLSDKGKGRSVFCLFTVICPFLVYLQYKDFKKNSIMSTPPKIITMKEITNWYSVQF